MRLTRLLTTALVLCVVAIATTGCGKRGELERPAGSTYPRPYPPE